MIILAKSLREYKKISVCTILLSMLEVVFEIVIPLCMSNLIDFGIEEGEMPAVVRYGVYLLIFAILQLITGVASAILGAKASTGFSANLRQDMYDRIQTFSFSNIDRFSSSSIVTRLTTDVTNIQNAYQMLIRMAIRTADDCLFHDCIVPDSCRDCHDIPVINSASRSSLICDPERGSSGI